MKVSDPVLVWGTQYFGEGARFSRQTLVQIFDNIPDAVVITDNQGHYLAVNAAACQLLGYSRDQLLRMRVTDLVAPLEAIGEHYARYCRAGQERGDIFLRRPDGTDYIAEYHATRLDANLHVSVLRDVTQLRSDDDRLRILQIAVAHLNDAIVISSATSASPKVLWANDAFYRMTGYSEAEVIGHSPRFLRGQGTDPETCERIRQALRSGQPVRAELQNYRKDGTPFWVELDITPVPDKNRHCSHWVSVQRDSTARKQRETAEGELGRRFRQMVDALPHIAWISDTQGRLLVTNRRWYEFTGMEPGASFNVEEALALIHPDDLTEVRIGLDAIPFRTEPFQMEYRLRRYDGTYRWHHERSMPVYNDDGVVVQWVGTMTDIEDRKSQEVALRDSEERYALVVDGTQDGIWDCDLETGYTYHSPRWLEILGYVTPEEQALIPAHSSSFIALVHPEDFPSLSQTVHDHFQGKIENYRSEFRMRHRDGSYRWIAARGKALRRPDGTPYRFAGAHSDITDKKWAEEELRRTRHFIDRMATTTPDIFYIFDIVAGENVFVNREIVSLLGYPSEGVEHMGLNLLSLFHPEDWSRIVQDFVPIRNHLKDQEFAEVEYRMRHQDGTWHWIFCRETPFARDESGKVTQVFGVAQDITPRKIAEEGHRMSEERLLFALEAAQEGIWDWDFERDTVFVTPSWLNALGYGNEVVITNGAFVQSLFHPDEVPQLMEVVDQLEAGENNFSVEMRLRHRNGHYIWVLSRARVVARNDKGGIARLVGSNLDITERKAMEQSLLWRAQHDSLTSLFNRDYVREKIKADITPQAMPLQPGTHGALLLLDLDGFKYVNDSLGHDAGDKVLNGTARRLTALLAEQPFETCLARIGGDEFAVWLPRDMAISDMETAVSLLSREILDTLAEPLIIPLATGDIREILLTSSIGIALFPQDGWDTETLYKNADTALYQAKEAGRGCYRFHSAQRSQAVSDRFHLETRLRSAVHHEELHLVYQPQIDLVSGHIVSVEALARWSDRELGNVPPSTFIPIAEETGLIHLLGDWTLRTACQQLAEWQHVAPDLRVCVNVSPLEIVEPRIQQSILKYLTEYHLPGTALELELTETALLRSGEHSTKAFLSEMRKQGVRLALDDFGTGYSSLSYLRSLPVDVVKIDRAFISDLPSNAQTRAIVKAIIDLAHALGLRVTAEGVETEAQKAILCELECDCLQGYLLSRPVPPEELTQMLYERFTRSLFPANHPLSSARAA